MTNEEAIARIKEFGLYHAIGDLPHSTHTVEAFNMAINELKNADLYAWHDIRKNPEDLPTDKCEVLVASSLGNNGRLAYDVMLFSTNGIGAGATERSGRGFYWHDSEYGAMFDKHVVKWKYIDKENRDG